MVCHTSNNTNIYNISFNNEWVYYKIFVIKIFLFFCSFSDNSLLKNYLCLFMINSRVYREKRTEHYYSFKGSKGGDKLCTFRKETMTRGFVYQTSGPDASLFLSLSLFAGSLYRSPFVHRCMLTTRNTSRLFLCYTSLQKIKGNNGRSHGWLSPRFKHLYFPFFMILPSLWSLCHLCIRLSSFFSSPVKLGKWKANSRLRFHRRDHFFPLPFFLSAWQTNFQPRREPSLRQQVDTFVCREWSD